MSYDAVVVGAGTAGLGAGCVLAKNRRVANYVAAKSGPIGLASPDSDFLVGQPVELHGTVES